MGKNNRIFCFGEVLWDEVDGDDFPGGAPLNVAYHVAKDAYFDVYMISSVGTDAAGGRMLSLMEGWSIDARFVQSNEDYPTGRVIADVSDKNNVSYDILQPVAWDYIREDDRLDGFLPKNACLIFGSLACRHAVSKQTLFKLLSRPCYRVFDINLRGDYYGSQTLSELLSNADLLKINREELAEVMRLLLPAVAPTSERDQLRALMKHFGVKEAIVTRGADGAGYYTVDGCVDVAGVAVSVVDTIGCGDAFLATFLRHRLTGTTVEAALASAVLTGAFIATKKGGCPAYALADLEVFTKDNLR